jgi:hypothetical protein
LNALLAQGGATLHLQNFHFPDSVSKFQFRRPLEGVIVGTGGFFHFVDAFAGFDVLLGFIAGGVSEKCRFGVQGVLFQKILPPDPLRQIFFAPPLQRLILRRFRTLPQTAVFVLRRILWLSECVGET